MTTPDEMKSAWQAIDQKLDASLRLNLTLLRTEKLKHVRTPLRWLAVGLVLEIVGFSVGLVMLGNFLADHFSHVRFAWPAAVLDIWFMLGLGVAIWQLVLVKGIDYDAPVAAIQRQLGQLRIVRLRSIRWALLTGQVVWWIPFYLILLQLVSAGGPASVAALYNRLRSFVVFNLCFSLALIPVWIWIARKWKGPMERSAGMGWLADQVSGVSLNDAGKFLADLAAFEES